MEKDDIVVNKIWARNGSVAVVDERLAGTYGSNEFPTFVPDRQRLEPRWFHWLTKMRWFWFQCDLKSRGTSGKNRIRPEKFLEIEIPLPPLSEQRRIVSKIERLAAKIEKAHGLRKRSRVEVDSLLDATYRKAFELQKHWKTAKVADFCEKPQYGYTASAIYDPMGPKFLRITDIQNGKVNWDTVPYCHCEEPGKYILEDGDLIFARTGATTGKSLLVKNCPEAVFASYLIRLRVKQMVIVEYLCKFFQSPVYWSQITADTRGTGQPNFNGKKLANLWIPVPPIDEQHHIVYYLDDIQAKIDNLKHLQEQTIAELDTLLPSILDKAFKGEL